MFIKFKDKIASRFDEDYEEILKLINKEIVSNLREINLNTKKIISKIEKESGWLFLNNMFILEDNFTNMHDPEFATHDSYRVIRGEEGFCIYTENASNDYFESIQQEEIKFYSKYKELLEQLHSYLLQKDNYLSGIKKLYLETSKDDDIDTVFQDTVNKMKKLK